MADAEDQDAREIIEGMLDGVEQAAPEFKNDLRELVIERLGKPKAADTAACRSKLPGTGNYARAFLDALDGFGLENVADWYDNLSWNDTVLCDRLSVERFLGPLKDACDTEGKVNVEFPHRERDRN